MKCFITETTSKTNAALKTVWLFLSKCKKMRLRNSLYKTAEWIPERTIYCYLNYLHYLITCYVQQGIFFFLEID